MKCRWAAAIVLTLVGVACGDDDGGDGPGVITPPETSAPALTPGTQEPAHTGATLAPTETPAEDPGATPDGGGDGHQVTLTTLVDKQHGLSADYVPGDLVSLPAAYLAPGFSASLRAGALAALTAMLDTAAAAGYNIRVRSGYRSYAEQQVTFQYWVDTLGYEEAVRVSAMPGHSEHQLGTAADLTTAEVGWELVEEFGSTSAGRWLAAHAHEYGFALSYPDGAEPITGYSYEPWHFRYIGEEEAVRWKASGLTLNQYLAR